MEKYSVLMSLYDKEVKEWFESSLKSMISQTIKPDEIILVIDGPINDKLQAVVNNYKSKFSEIFKIVPLDENVGLGRALDIGLGHCTNELVARMDTDDISLKSRCEKQLTMFEQDPDLAIVGTLTDEFYDDPKKIISSRIVPTENEEIKKFMKRRSPFNHPTVMFKKSAVIDSGGYGKFKRKQDLDLFSRMINTGHKAANIGESLLLFRSNENNYKRRKSWSYISSYVEVQFEIWKRGHCSFLDLAYVSAGQLFMFVLPTPLLKKLSNKYLREVKS